MEGSFVVSRKYENKLDLKIRKERGKIDHLLHNPTKVQKP